MPVMPPYVTHLPWRTNLQHEVYGTGDTYRLAAEWLKDCPEVADWGAASCHFHRYLPTTCKYIPVDGTLQCPLDVGQVVADLATYRTPTDGILLRHVLDMTDRWADVLRNAVASARRRLVVVTFTPDAEQTHLHKMKSGWPVWHFNPNDLRDIMGARLVREHAVQTTHPERVYYVEVPCAS